MSNRHKRRNRLKATTSKTGNVGIGTTAPTDELHIFSAGGPDLVLGHSSNVAKTFTANTATSNMVTFNTRTINSGNTENVINITLPGSGLATGVLMYIALRDNSDCAVANVQVNAVFKGNGEGGDGAISQATLNSVGTISVGTFAISKSTSGISAIQYPATSDNQNIAGFALIYAG